MSSKRSSQVVRFAVLLGLLFPSAAVYGRALTLGVISRGATEEVRRHALLVNYLAERLHDDGIDRGEVVLSGSAFKMAARMRSRTVDFFVGDALTGAAIENLGAGDLRMRRWKAGRAEYSSVIFVGAGSGLRNLHDLQGRVIAFETPLSTAGTLMPRLVLAQKGAHLVPRLDPSEDVPEDSVGYVFSGDPENTVVWVLRGKVAAGAVREDLFRAHAKKSAAELRIIYRTPALPAGVVDFSGAMHMELASHLGKLLAHMHEEEAGRTVLKALDGTTKFDAMPKRVRSLLASLARGLAGGIESK